VKKKTHTREATLFLFFKKKGGLDNSLLLVIFIKCPVFDPVEVYLVLLIFDSMKFENASLK
jgi:hypothetical protein